MPISAKRNSMFLNILKFKFLHVNLYVILHLELIVLLASNTRCPVHNFFLLVCFFYCTSDETGFKTKQVFKKHNLLKVFTSRL